MKLKFFILEYISPSEANYATEVIAIAQGLRQLGIPFYANVDYWFDPLEKEYLFKKAPEGYDADVHVYYDTFYFLRKMSRFAEVDYSKVNILVERNDELIPFWQTEPYKDFKKFDLLLIDHFNTNQHYPAGYSIKPWQIGFTNRVIRYNEKYKNNTVKDVILDTYRLHHNLRELAVGKLTKGLADVYPTRRVITDKLEDKEVNLDEVDTEYWKITGKRHNPVYFDQLNSALMTYVFGGFYHLNSPTFDLGDKIKRRLNRAMASIDEALGKDSGKYYFVYQWDSYRLWEALLSNTCPIFLDFDYWGFELPVKPVNGVHYIGVKGFDFEETIERIKGMKREEILQIGVAGKQWALDNYGPEAVALRMMDEISQLTRYKKQQVRIKIAK